MYKEKRDFVDEQGGYCVYICGPDVGIRKRRGERVRVGGIGKKQGREGGVKCGFWWELRIDAHRTVKRGVYFGVSG